MPKSSKNDIALILKAQKSIILRKTSKKTNKTGRKKQFIGFWKMPKKFD